MANTQKASVLDVLEQELEKSKVSYKQQLIITQNGQSSPMSGESSHEQTPKPVATKPDFTEAAQSPIKEQDEEFIFEGDRDSQELLQDESIKGTPIKA